MQADSSIYLSKIKSFYFTFAFFMMSLISVNFGSFALFSIAGYILFLLLLCKEIRINIIYFPLVPFLFFSALVGVGGFGEIKYSNLMGFILSLSVFILFSKMKKESINNAIIAIKYVIYIHLSLFFIEFILYYAFDVKLSYLGLIGLESRNLDGSRTIFSYQAYRASGLFEEPSTFIASVFLLYVPIANRSSLLLSLLVALAGVLTLSSLGFILGGLILFSLVLKLSFFKKIIAVLLATPFFTYVATYQLNRVFMHGDVGYDPVSVRTAFLEYIFNRDWLHVLLGNGVGTFNENNVINNDLGAVPILFFLFGIFSVPLLIMILKSWKKNPTLVFGLLLLKVPVYYPFFWVIVFLNNRIASFED
ncbi:hypothetical protein ACK331_00875 [Aeromonas veronii]